jgi:uncharacterized SAM-binding protein YcdF (DUF218 family)
MLKKSIYILGAVCLFFGLAPLIYGIFHVGTAALCGLGVFIALLPALWKWLGSYPKLRAVFGAAVGVFLLCFAALSAMMAQLAWFNAPEASGRATVIVLGAQINNDQPSLMLARRLNAALEYMRANPEAICIVTGGQGQNETQPEARVMARYLAERGIAGERILAEERSTNTRENMRFAAELLREAFPERAGDPIAVATDSFHQMRASIYARAEFGVDGVRALPSYTPWGLMPSYWVREMFGITLAWLQTL